MILVGFNDDIIKRYGFPIKENDIEYLRKLSDIEEEWRPIRVNNEKTQYMVSNLGFIYNCTKKKFVPLNHRDEYKKITLKFDGKTHTYGLHQIVAWYFCKFPKHLALIGDRRLVVPDHIDGIKHHNAAFNLEWVSTKENSVRAWKNGLNDGYKGENSHLASIDEKTARKIIEMIMHRNTNAEIMKTLHVSSKTVQHIRSKESWVWLSEGLEFPKLSEAVPYTTDESVIRAICEELEKKELNNTEIAKKFGVKREYVKDIKTRRRRKDISKYYNF